MDVIEVIDDLVADTRDIGVGRELYLCETSHSRLHQESVLVAGDELVEPLGLDYFGPFGSGTDKAHFPPQDVEQLREFIDVGDPEEIPHPRYPVVALLRPLDSGSHLAVVVHGSDLEDFVTSPVQSDSGLAIEHWPGGRQFHRKCGHTDENHNARQQQDGRGIVESHFHARIPPDLVGHPNRGIGSQAVDLRPRFACRIDWFVG